MNDAANDPSMNAMNNAKRLMNEAAAAALRGDDNAVDLAEHALEQLQRARAGTNLASKTNHQGDARE